MEDSEGAQTRRPHAERLAGSLGDPLLSRRTLGPLSCGLPRASDSGLGELAEETPAPRTDYGYVEGEGRSSRCFGSRF